MPMITGTDEITQEKWPLHSTSEMGRQEAEEITKAIQQNFDSLGMMLKSANERKAWKALGYVNFASYCENEFGKSKSRAYQIIEEAEIAQRLRESAPADLKIPANSQLRILKNLSLAQQIEAIKCAEDLAATTKNKKPTNLQIRLAVEKTANKPEQFKHSLNELGFSKGAEVVVVRGMDTGSRGFIRKLDKKGQLWIELHTRNSSLIPYDVTQLQILQASEKPSKTAYFGTTEIGDKVLIFSRGFENKIGEIAVRINEKMVGVRLENGRIVELPYAELEPIETELYEQEEPSDTLPSEQLTTLIQTQLITCGAEKTKLATDIIASVWRMLDSSEKEDINNLLQGDRNTKLREYKKANEDLFSINNELRDDLLRCHREAAELQTRLDEAEQVIAQMVSATQNQPTEPDTLLVDAFTGSASKTTALGISFNKTIDQLIAGKKTQTRRAWQQDYAKNFVRYFEEGIKIPALSKGRHRGGHELGFIKLTQRPYQQYLSEMSLTDLQEEGGMVATVQEFIDTYFEEQDKLVWVLHFEFEALSGAADVEVDTILETVDTSNASLDTALYAGLKIEIAQQRENVEIEIEALSEQKKTTTRGKVLNKLNKQICRLYDRLSILDTFEKIEVGQTVTKKRFPETVGTVISLDFSPGGMPQVWVRWFEPDSTDSNSVEVLDFVPDIQEPEQW
jgi:hypothetical protein